MKTDGFAVKVSVPSGIIVTLKKELGDGIHYRKGLHIVQEIIYKHQRCFAPMFQYFPYDCKLKKSIAGGSKFYDIWGKLERMGIIEVKPLAGGR